MARPIDPRNARTLRNDAQAVARLRAALALDPGPDPRAADDVIQACDALTNALRRLIAIAEEGEAAKAS